MRAAAALGLRRALAAPGRWLPVAATIAIALGLLGTLAAAGVVAGDHAARGVLRGLGDQGKASLTWSFGASPAVDAEARATLARLGARPVTRGVTLYPTDFGRTIVRLGGIEPVGPAVRLLEGRLPQGACRPARCEVLHVAGLAPRRELAARGLRLAVVGRALVTDPRAIGFTTAPPDFAARSARHEHPLLLSADPAGVDALAPLTSLARTHNWSAPLPLAGAHAWDLDEQAAALAELRSELDREAGGFTLTAPLLALEAARERSRLAPGRLTAVGAAALGVLAAFLLLTASAVRRGARAEDARLLAAGATRGQRAALALAETGVPVLAGVLAGTALAVAGAAVRARAGGVPVDGVLGDAAGALALRAAVAGLLAWGLVLAAALLGARAARGAALAALLAAGGVLAGALVPRDGGDPLPAVVLPLAAGAGGLLAALALPGLLRGAARRAPRPALLELARRPGPAAVAVAGLTVALGVGGFALAYRATLDRSRDDQALHRVPVAAVVAPGPDVRSPLAVRSDWAGLPGVRAAYGVLRHPAAVYAGPTRRDAGLVALPAAAAAELRGWRAADADGERRALAARLRPPGAPPPGVAVPADGELRLAARATGEELELAAVVRAESGAVTRVELGVATARPGVLRARLPAGRLVALEVAPRSDFLATVGHNTAEGGGGEQAAGTLTLGTPRIAGRPAPLRGWRPRDGLEGTARRIDYRLTGRALLRPDTATDRAPLPVLADPATARDADGATVELAVLGVRVPVRVAGVTRRFPTVPGGGRLVVADAEALGAALDARAPGLGAPRELWAEGDGEAVARAARESGLRVRTQAATLAAIRAEPVAREVLGALLVAALLGGVVGLAGLAVAVRSALRDDAAALLDLEAQGVGPRALRRALALRGVALAALGVVAGLLLALALTRLVTSAVRAGATGVPDPPLVAVVPWEWAALAAPAVILLGAVVSAAAAAGAFREPAPRLPAAAEAA